MFFAEVNARDVGKKRIGGGIDVDADAVNAILDDAAESLGKSRLLHIVLILTDADSLRLDLNELGEGILETSRDGDGTSLHNVELGELLCRELGCRIYRRARLRDDGVLDAPRAGGIAEDLLCDELLGLTGRRAVTDRDNVDAVLIDEAEDGRLGALDVLTGLDGVNYRGVEDLARLVTAPRDV